MIRWIASYPKSGNTWVRLFLMAYADPGAFDLNQRSADHTQDTNADVYEQVAAAELQCLSDTEARLLRGAVLVRLSRLAKANSGGPAYLKTHSANVTVNGLAWIPPDFTERSVYILRDPRDVAVSLADHLGLSLDDAIAAMGGEQRELGRGFGGVPMNIELRLSVEDSPNSAGETIDAIRCCKLARERGLAGPMVEVSAYTMKHPPVQFPDYQGLHLLEEFIAGNGSLTGDDGTYRPAETTAKTHPAR